MTSETNTLFENCASIAEICDLEFQIAVEAFRTEWPTDEAWRLVDPNTSREDALQSIRRALDRCILTGRVYADAVAASAGGAIRSMTDDQVSDVMDLGLAADMPELTSGQMSEGSVLAARKIVRLSFNERLAQIKMQMFTAAAAQIARERQGDLSRLVEVGRTLAELAMLEAPNGFDLSNDPERMIKLKVDMFSYLPELDWMDEVEAEDRVKFIFAAAEARLSEIRVSSTGYTQPSDQKHGH